MDLKKAASVALIAFVIVSVAFLAYKEAGQGSVPAGSAGFNAGGEQSNSESAPGKEDPTKVVAYYFHSQYTCISCIIMENYIKEALQQYPEQLRSGVLEFRSIDVDRPENRHYLQDFQVAANSVVLSLQSDDSVLRSSNLSGVFLYAGDKAKLIQYVGEEVERYLREVAE